VGSEDTKEAGEVDSWLHHQRAEAFEELGGVSQYQHRRSTPGLLEPVPELAVVSAGQAVEGDGAAGTVRAQALEALPVVGMGVGVGVKHTRPAKASPGKTSTRHAQQRGGQGIGAQPRQRCESP
jgi:hypothetical protein